MWQQLWNVHADTWLICYLVDGRTADTSGKRISDAIFFAFIFLWSSPFLWGNINEISMLAIDTDTRASVVEPTNSTVNAQVTTYDCSSSPFSLRFFSSIISSRLKKQILFFISLSKYFTLDDRKCQQKNMTHFCNNNWMGVCDRMKMSEPKTRAKVKPMKQTSKWMAWT